MPFIYHKYHIFNINLSVNYHKYHIFNANIFVRLAIAYTVHDALIGVSPYRLLIGQTQHNL